jgi:putative ABC transport system permease protein
MKQTLPLALRNLMRNHQRTLTTLTLALRNLMRNRQRSMTTLLAMVVGVGAILIFGGYSHDITNEMQTDFVQRSGHLQIQRSGYFLYGSGNSAAYGIPGYEKLIAALKSDPVLKQMVVVVTPTLQLGGIAGNFNAGVSRTVLVQGMVAADEAQLRKWNDYALPLIARPLPLNGSGPDAIVIGEGVARVLQLCAELKVSNCDAQRKAADSAATGAPPADAPPDLAALSALEAPPVQDKKDKGTQIEVLATNVHGAPNVGSFTVIKAEQLGVKELDDVHVAMHLPSAQRLVYGRDAPQVTAVLIQLQHTDQIPAARARIQELLSKDFKGADLAILDFDTLNPYYGQTNRMFSALFGFVFVLIGAIVVFVVSNTMSMTIYERTVEIGTLRAIGQRCSGIEALFITEGALLGIIGSALGVLIALVISGAINFSGLTWIPPSRIDPVPLTVRVWGEWPMIALSFCSLTVVAALSAWVPARGAAKQAIVDALRHV